MPATTIRIALVGERDTCKTAHRGIEASLAMYRTTRDINLDWVWIPTSEIQEGSLPSALRQTNGIWCVPGSPYANTSGAIAAIHYARTSNIPFLGTCGGFQHALMEFAQNVARVDASHAELTPEAPSPLIVKLSCSLAESTGKVIVSDSSLFLDIIGAAESEQEFNCNYGMNADLTGIFRNSDLAFVAHDELGQPRAFRIRSHPFFIGTLFQPERSALKGTLHPIVIAFLDACLGSRSTKAVD